MNLSNPLLRVVIPLVMVVGIYLLIRCIARLKRLIFPAIRVRFPASATPYTLALPQAGRYVISVLIPPLTFITGVAHFSARFSVTRTSDGTSLNYRSYGRSLFRVQRSDMSGKQSLPLGEFQCGEPGELQVTCLNPESIRADYELEVAPHVPVLTLFALVLATIASSFMAIGGFVMSLIVLFGAD
ncbi:hypothetical protein SJI00_08050 [Pseudomonas sp. RP23018S]|uniref:hypothetical protein n=1 Tax=Pseudomonas sp. RP23018S TaxID=3096037 RepID=UPI002ACA8E0F|nr:hypothetical protein [Pseudomonas sp. RP23018S]MDZ5602723.1 hypothetical protein [Pseudomonas sp. RP23018S]